MDVTPMVTVTIDPRRLPGWRKQLGLTQEELAHRIGASAQELSRLESALRPGGLMDRVIEGLSDAAAAGNGDDGDLIVLRYISRHPGQRPGEIGIGLGWCEGSKSAGKLVSGVVERLRRRGLVVEHRGGWDVSSDGRRLLDSEV